MRRSTGKNNRAGQLVSDYQTVLLAQATAQAARREAATSENNLLQQLASATRGLYLSGAALNELPRDYIAQASVDAHLKKVQADQITTLSNSQTDTIVRQAHSYIGRKVRIIRTDAAFNPFDAAWYDKSHGYRASAYNKQILEGSIDAILFDKNLLVIKPKRLRRLINSNLQYYMVYVINPETLLPAVTVTFTRA